MPTLICSREGCDNEFYRRPAYLKKLKGSNIYCSFECRDYNKRIKLKCSHPSCDNEFTKVISQVKLSDNHFCSHDCYTHSLYKRIKTTCFLNSCHNEFTVGSSQYKGDIHFCSKRCRAKSKAKYPKTSHLRHIIHKRKHVLALKDYYVKDRIIQMTSLDREEISEDFVKLKRATLKAHRQFNQTQIKNN